jgi:hypothetical protein
MNLPRANGDEYDGRSYETRESGAEREETIAFALRGDATAFQWLIAVFHLVCFSILGLGLTANNAAAQTIGHRQTNLVSDLPDVANNLRPNLVDPWGLPSCQASQSLLLIIMLAVSPFMMPLGSAPRPAVSPSRMPPGQDSTIQPELLPIRIRSLEAHRLSNRLLWSTRGRCSPGHRTL